MPATARRTARHADHSRDLFIVVIRSCRGSNHILRTDLKVSRYAGRAARKLPGWRSITIGTHHVTAILDAYNLFNQALEVEEFSVTGATSRLTSAVQPPRVVQIGLRVPF